MTDRPNAPKRVSTRPGTAPTAPQPTRRAVRATPATATKGGGSGSGSGKPPQAKGADLPRWRRITKRVGIYALLAGAATLVVGAIGVGIYYAKLEIPAPDDFASAQSSTLYFADGKQVMGRLGVADREVVAFDSVPAYVPNALVAAEDRSFYTNPGVDFAGMTRALYKTIVKGEKQGGSTITQQYVERYYVGQTTTDVKGKVREALLALKIDSQQDKETVLGNYMNTIYFGRGAYGIETAARQYFKKGAASLSISEAALLAGIVPAPSAWDPAVDPTQARYRWNYVLDGMLEGGFITQAERTAAVFPETVDYRNTDVYGGPKGYLLRTAIEEVSAQTGITQDDIETGGYRIVTTIDRASQVATQQAVAKMPKDHAPNLRVGAITLNPDTGAIMSMYGGADYVKIQRNAATQDIAQAGSTFKPFALVAGLESGIALESTYLGNNNMTIPGFDNKVRNFANASYGYINLIRATQDSVNTVYAQLAQDVGPAAVKEVAIRAGVPETTPGLEDNAANVLGTASPHLVDMAHAYATFAAQGMRTEPFIVETVSDSQGNEVYTHEVVRERQFQADVMSEATYAMTQVVQKGSGTFARELGRPLAGKTGTSNDNQSAWFVGYTPQVVGAVVLYQVGEDGSVEPITPFGGFQAITGGSIPVRIFTWMMGPILEGTDVVQFPRRAFIGDVVSSEPSPSPTPTPQPQPSEAPKPSKTPKPTPSPQPSVPPGQQN